MANGFKVDKVPGCGLQPWSRGSIFPLVIARVERYHPTVSGNTLEFARWNVIGADEGMSGFASYDDAYLAAVGWLLAHYADVLDGIAKQRSLFMPVPEDVRDMFRHALESEGADPATIARFEDEGYAWEVKMNGDWHAIDSTQAEEYQSRGFEIRAFEV